MRGVINNPVKVSYFGGGCFWNAERIFHTTDGVIDTEVGFCTPVDKTTLSRTADVEVVKVTYDPDRISYRELIKIFWTTHNPLNPTNSKRSNAERSVLFCLDSVEENIAREELAQNPGYYTSVESFRDYRRAPEKDQKYYLKN